MINDTPSSRPVIVAAIAATVIILISGVAIHTLVARVGWSTSRVTIAPDVLDGFPINIGDWTGEDVPMDEAIVRGTGTDAHINRHYSHTNGLESVSLYIGCGGRTATVAYHQPNVCYIGSGWSIEEQQSLDLPLSKGSTLPCTIYQFIRNELNKTRVTVLHYWIVDGRICRNASFLRSRLWRINSKVNYVAQVQIVSSVRTSTADSSKRIVSDFAVDFAPSIAELFERIQLDQTPQSMVSLEEKSSL